MIEQKTINLLDKIGYLWPPPYSDLQLKEISIIWNKKLFFYDDDILTQAFEELAEKFHRKPTLADFLKLCKEYQARKAPFVANVIKNDWIDWYQYRSRITTQFGEKAAKIFDEARKAYDEAKRTGKTSEYIHSIWQEAQKVIKKINPPFKR